ncbi:homogentisate 1,2-dioxygenase [Schleiferia thermophila]|jgi:homogentisate 1,2-dioxygenase|uniref:Homogentisate 1,2-dioxygenase n=1 Tax=Schleiferia thermophila TaxID=884107 RepID=A0A369A787_9FLAO|nr:homogentisate 1,2-dioxygenase [Schleiferia thermophila]KFD39745.1 homogentisate 1,2-dioxygenase [Schleiferia thermophila str. Yellowstone]RCX03947.1 homogentisate 1,2-dioxygenase [Schleiferia thermophila]
MPIYHTLGIIPRKRHTVFRKPDGSLYYEQLFGTEGFSGVSSLLYHHHRPTMVKEIRQAIDLTPKASVAHNVTSRMLRGWDIEPDDDFLESRRIVLFNNDLNIALAAPASSMEEYFYKNADSDELIFVHKGSGVLRTFLGNISFSYGDYLVIPRGTIYQIQFETSDNRLLIIESFSPIVTPKRYRNQFGQLLEHSPFCERDIRRPQVLETYDETGDFLIKIKKQNHLHQIIYASHPFDVVGWDGYFYPYAFSAHDFEPITGRIHQPPPVHQTFEGHNFVICTFAPRLYDYHPDSIPAPYNHSNIDSDEVLYYVDGDFMSRNHVEKGYISLHPAGIPHGPHPGAIERSIGQKETKELAVMIDTFKPLKLTDTALLIENEDYYRSWLE